MPSSAALLFAAAVPTRGQNTGGPGGQGGAGGVGPPQAPPSGTSGAPRAWFGGGVGSVGQTLTGNIGVTGGTFRREPDLSINPSRRRPIPRLRRSSAACFTASMQDGAA